MCARSIPICSCQRLEAADRRSPEGPSACRSTIARSSVCAGSRLRPRRLHPVTEHGYRRRRIVDRLPNEHPTVPHHVVVRARVDQVGDWSARNRARLASTNSVAGEGEGHCCETAGRRPLNQLATVRRPARVRAAAGRDLRFGTGLLKPLDVDLTGAGLERAIGDPFAVR